MLSLYKIPPYSHKIKQKFSNTNLNDNSKDERDVERPQMTSNADSAVNPATNKKSKLDVGSMYQIDENNDEHLGEILHNNNLYKEIAMQIISFDKTVRSNTVQELKNFNSQSLAIQAKKGEQLVSMMPAFKKSF